MQLQRCSSRRTYSRPTDAYPRNRRNKTLSIKHACTHIIHFPDAVYIIDFYPVLLFVSSFATPRHRRSRSTTSTQQPHPPTVTPHRLPFQKFHPANLQSVPRNRTLAYSQPNERHVRARSRGYCISGNIAADAARYRGGQITLILTLPLSTALTVSVSFHSQCDATCSLSADASHRPNIIPTSDPPPSLTVSFDFPK